MAGQHPTDRMAGIRIIDFGSAVNLNREGLDALAPGQLLERYRHVCGTPGFWSPRLSRLYRDMNDLSEAVWSESPAPPAWRNPAVPVCAPSRPPMIFTP